MPLQATSGAASYDAFGGGVPVVPAYIEEVFSTYFYNGSASTQTITNEIDLSTKGGLVWLKDRSTDGHYVSNTVNGNTKYLRINRDSAENANGVDFAPLQNGSFNSNGFTLNSVNNTANNSGRNYVSWTFRKKTKFFDVVTWTGTGANTTIAHALESVPACIMVKRTDVAGDWQVYHRSLANTEYLVLNSTAAAASGATRWNSTTPTSTVFSIGTDATVNASGGTYVAYIYAHDAGGFGLTGTDNVISCGSFTTDGSGNTSVTLGYEPQWVMVKRSSGVSDWTMFDTMRGMPTAAASGIFSATLLANTTAAEDAAGGTVGVNATGFNSLNGYLASSSTFIYIAIRRGPMKTPTVGTSVFSPTFTSVSTSPLTVTTNFPVDLTISRWTTVMGNYVIDRLRGASDTLDKYLFTNATDAEANISGLSMQSNTAVIDSGFLSGGSNPKIFWNFRRAPSFFDEVCYTGTGSATTVTHNLAAVPELMIVKKRNDAAGWAVWSKSLSSGDLLQLNTTDAKITNSGQFTTNSPTSNVFYVGTEANTNQSTYLYVAYLFATCAGVSKVGSYTGTGTTLQIDCGFTAGSRFVLIKRTDSTGDWYVWDSARGIVAGNDPYLLLNSTAAEVTGTDYVDTYAAGFEISSTAPAAINASGGTYIFLAIA
jgi:hypothetical protein